MVSCLVVLLALGWSSMAFSGESGGYRLQGGSYLDLPGANEKVQSADLADLNDDGVLDAVAVLRDDVPLLRSFLALEPLCFQETAEMVIPFTGQVILVDVTDDGRIDALVSGNTARREITVLEGDGVGGFTLLSVFDSFESNYVFQFAFADVDGDEHTDILFANRAAGIAYGPDFSSATALPGGRGAPVGILPVDLDADGLLDILLGHERENVFRILLGRGGRVFEAVDLEGGGSGPLLLHDVDGDGQDEVVAPRFSEIFVHSLGRRDDTWEITSSRLYESSIGLEDYSLGDVNSDGVADLIVSAKERLVEVAFGRREQGTLVFDEPAFLTGRPTFTVGPIGNTPPWQISGVKDIDGDGVRDVLFGSGYLLGSAGARMQAARVIQDFVRNTSAATGDLNGDGLDDLVLHTRDQQFEIFLGAEGGLEPMLEGPEIQGTRKLAIGDIVGAGSSSLLAAESDEVRVFDWSVDGLVEGPTLSGLGGTPNSMVLLPWDSSLGEQVLVSRRETSELYSVSLLAPSADPATLVELWKVFAPFRTRVAGGADLDGDGWSDLVYTNPLGALVARGSAEGPLAYSAAIRFPWDDFRTTAVLDVDGDGASEVLAGGGGTPASVILARRQADGTWSTEFLTGTGRTAALQVGDVNGDGREDVVAGTSNGFEVFFNLGGLFSEPQEILARGNIVNSGSIAAGDFDGNGNLDLIGATRFNVMMVLSDQDSVLMAAGSFPYPCAHLSAKGDLNGDGRTDLLLDCEFGTRLHAVFGEPDGAFSDPVPVELNGGAEKSITLADLNHDDLLDLVVTFSGADGVFFAAGLGNGVFEAPLPFPGLAGDFFFIRTGDLNGDGATDLVLSRTSSDIYVVFGDDRILERQPLVIDVGVSLRALAVVDLNGDGFLDLIWRAEGANSQTVWQVLPGNGDGSFSEVKSLPPVNVRNLANLLVDMNADGFPDTLLSDEEQSPVDVRLLLGKGDFTFEEKAIMDLRSYGPLAFTDLNGDLRVDLIAIQNDLLFVLPGISETDFGPPKYFSSARPLHFLFFDMNGDDIDDVWVGTDGGVSTILASPAAFLESARIFLIPEVTNMVAMDFDGDDRSELAAYRSDLGAVQILALADDGEIETLAEVDVDVADGSGIPGLEVADVDEDGRDDLLVLSGGSVRWYRRGVGLSFEEARTLIDGVHSFELSFHDLNRDGAQDILFSGFAVALGRGGGVFELKNTYGGSSAFISSTGDFNGDGNPDVAHGPRPGGVLYISEGDGNGNFVASQFLPSPGTQTLRSTIGDFNGDDRLDIVLADVEEGQPEVWYMTEEGGLERGNIVAGPHGESEGTVGLQSEDLNDDGFWDVLRAESRGAITTYLGSSEGLQPTTAAVFGPQRPSFFLAGRYSTADEIDVVFADTELERVFHSRGATLTLEPIFQRGDGNADGHVDIADAIWAFQFLFGDGPPFPCEAAADANGDVMLDLSDGMFVIMYRFLGGSQPVEPFPGCGVDPNVDGLGCASYPPCG